MFLNALATLTLATFIGGLEGDATHRGEAKAIVASEVESLVAAEKKTHLAPPLWFQCIAEAKASRVLEREVLRLYREEEGARIMEPSEIVLWATKEICDDAYYEN